MDYNQTYQSYYNRYYNGFEKKIKQLLIESKAGGGNFNELYTEIQKFIKNEIPKRTTIDKNDNLKSLLGIYKNRHTKFDLDLPEEEVIDKIFKNQIATEFNKLCVYSTNKEYEYKDLIREIALLNVCEQINRLLHNNSNFFNMFYRANMFEGFEIREYLGIGVENTEIYKKLNKILYPDYYMNSNENVNIVKIETERESQELDNISKTSGKLSNKLTVNEKSFLFHVMCKAISEKDNKKGTVKDEFNLPYTELLRLISLINFYDEKVFTEKYRDSNHYQILSQGLNHLKIENRLLFLQNLIKNIEEYKLTKTTKYIKEIANKTANQAILSKK